MFRTMLKSKIHRATVTHADLDHAGSVTIDEDLMDAADLLAGEQVAIVDLTNGARLETYVVPGERGTGVLGVNGAAAHLVHPDDLVIVISYVVLAEERARTYRPTVVFVDADNRPVDLDADPTPVPADDGFTDDTPPAPAWPTAPPAAAGPTTGPIGPTGLISAAETDDAARLDALIQAGA